MTLKNLLEVVNNAIYIHIVASNDDELLVHGIKTDLNVIDMEEYDAEELLDFDNIEVEETSTILGTLVISVNEERIGGR